jgi:hypothetical protein
MMDKTQCAECERLARKVEELAAQNLAMRDALEKYYREFRLAGDLLVSPDLATDILRKRDVETLRKAATRIDEPMYPDEPRSRLDFNRGWNAKCADLLRLVAELEKSQ